MMKTERHILDRIAQSPKGLFAFSYGYRAGSSMKPRSWGSRVHGAACNLRDKGLVKFTATQDYRDCRSCYTDHWTEVVVVLA